MGAPAMATLAATSIASIGPLAYLDLRLSLIALLICCTAALWPLWAWFLFGLERGLRKSRWLAARRRTEARRRAVRQRLTEMNFVAEQRPHRPEVWRGVVQDRALTVHIFRSSIRVRIPAPHLILPMELRWRKSSTAEGALDEIEGTSPQGLRALSRALCPDLVRRAHGKDALTLQSGEVIISASLKHKVERLLSTAVQVVDRLASSGEAQRATLLSNVLHLRGESLKGAALNELIAEGTVSIPLVAEVAKSTKVPRILRIHAVGALADHIQTDQLAALIAALEGLPTHDRERLEARLIRLLERGALQVRLTAAGALGALGTPAALRALKDATGPVSPRALICRALQATAAIERRYPTGGQLSLHPGSCGDVSLSSAGALGLSPSDQR